MAKSNQMHPYWLPIDSLGGKAVGDSCDFDILLEYDFKDEEVIFSSSTGHDPLDWVKPDVVFVVDAIGLQPEVEIFGCGVEMVDTDHFGDEIVVHPNLKYILK